MPLVLIPRNYLDTHDLGDPDTWGLGINDIITMKSGSPMLLVTNMLWVDGQLNVVETMYYDEVTGGVRTLDLRPGQFWVFRPKHELDELPTQ